MHHTYLSPISEISVLNPADDIDAIHELRNQLFKERFVDKLARFVKPSDTHAQDTQSQVSNTHQPSWNLANKKSIAAGCICLSLTSLAASPWGVQNTANLMGTSVSHTASEQADTTMFHELDMDTVAAEASTTPLPGPTVKTPSPTERAFFIDTLWDGSTPAEKSGLAIGGLPLEQQAFLMTIAQAEGATYTTIFGGSQFSDFSKHPEKCIPINFPGYEGMCSDAAGKYQFLSSTWDLLGLPDFSPKNQDLGAVMLIEETNAFKLLEQGNVAGAFCAIGPIWASLPCNSYGQNPKSVETIVGMYERNLQTLKEAN